MNARAKYISIILFLIYLSACNGVAEDVNPTIAIPNSYTEHLNDLSLPVSKEMVEIIKLPAPPESGPIGKIHYQMNENILLAVYTGNGALIGWDISAGITLFEYDLNIVSQEGLVFDQSGSLVMGATRHEIRDNGYGEMTEYVGGVAIWSTQTGSQVNCVIVPCEGYPAPIASAEIPGHLGAILDPEGHWTLTFDERTLGIHDLITDNGVIEVISHPDDWKSVGRVAFNATGSQFAMAFQEGQVWIRDTRVTPPSLFSPGIRLGENVDGDMQKIPALTFAPNNQWLARIRGDQLSIWRLGTLFTDHFLEHPILEGNLLAFDQSGRLLFMATNQKLLVLDIQEKKIVSEYDMPGVTDITVSDDNRLLIWGDKLGIIHIWGIPK